MLPGTEAQKRASPSRNYVAMCIKHNGREFYFRRFMLPLDYEGEDNCVAKATWFYLNILNGTAHVATVMPIEEYWDFSQE